MREKWRDVGISHFNTYQVSTLGNVRYYRTSRGAKAKFRVPWLKTSKQGYHTLTLGVVGNRSYHLLHRLIATTFIPNPENFPQVDHISRDKTDNRVVNLRWVSHVQQSLNKSVRVDNRLGVEGVRLCRRGRFYRAEVKLHGHGYHLGDYETLPEAYAARQAGERILHGWLLHGQKLFSAKVRQRAIAV